MHTNANWVTSIVFLTLFFINNNNLLPLYNMHFSLLRAFHCQLLSANILSPLLRVRLTRMLLTTVDLKSSIVCAGVQFWRLWTSCSRHYWTLRCHWRGCAGSGWQCVLRAVSSTGEAAEAGAPMWRSCSRCWRTGMRYGIWCVSLASATKATGGIRQRLCASRPAGGVTLPVPPTCSNSGPNGRHKLLPCLS